MQRTLSFAAILLASLSLLPSSHAAEDESESDLKKMAGDWVPVLMQLNGKKQPDEVTKAINLTIRGNKYNTVVGKEKDEGTLKLDATKEPREMDISSNVGENKGKAIPCIYEIKTNELRVCYGLNGTARPADFNGEDEKGVVMLITYKRAPKSKR
ncbi:MAG: TIGR03067 domain-containing protein [Pirellulaceae bacterium]